MWTSEPPELCVTHLRQNAHLPGVNSAFASGASLDFGVFGGSLISVRSIAYHRWSTFISVFFVLFVSFLGYPLSTKIEGFWNTPSRANIMACFTNDFSFWGENKWHWRLMKNVLVAAHVSRNARMRRYQRAITTTLLIPRNVRSVTATNLSAHRSAQQKPA